MYHRRKPTHVVLEHDVEDAQIARINELTNVGRANWFGLLAYLAFTGVTLLSVTDADFFIDTRQTTLPLIGVAIPTFSFFIFAPILGAALYVYLHLHIRKLAEALTIPAPLVKGEPLERHLKSWLLNDLILMMRGDSAYTRRRLDWFSRMLTLLLVWWSGPLVLFGFWWRSWPAHDEWLTTLLGMLALFSTYAGYSSWRSIKEQINEKSRPIWWRVAGATIGAVGGAAILTLGAIKTEFGYVNERPLLVPVPSMNTGIVRWFEETYEALVSLAPINLRNLRAVDVAAEQLDYRAARRTFRINWCAREDMSMSVCGAFPDRESDISSRLGAARQAWCDTNSEDIHGACSEHFEAFDLEFVQSWQRYRSAQLAELAAPDLSGADLRNADLDGAILLGVDLSGARLNGATGRNIQFQGADLSDATLIGVYFSEPQFQGALMHQSIFRGAYLTNAQFHWAHLVQSDFRGADVRQATLNGANLSLADFRGTRLERIESSQYTSFRQAGIVITGQFSGASLLAADAATIGLLRLHWDDFLAAGEGLPDDAVRPEHWMERPTHAILELGDPPNSLAATSERISFDTAWRAWAAEAHPDVTIAPDWHRETD